MTQFSSVPPFNDDHPQHNPTNPFLVAFRDGFDGDMRGWGMWLVLARLSEIGTPEEEGHARKVLTRLANLADKEN